MRPSGRLSLMPTLVLLAAAATAPTAQADPWWEDEQDGAAWLVGTAGDQPGTVVLTWVHPVHGYLEGYAVCLTCEGDRAVVRGYEVHRSDDGGATFAEVAVVDSADQLPICTCVATPPTEGYYIDKGLDPAASYVYRLRLLVDVLNSGDVAAGAFSNEVTVQPSWGELDAATSALPCAPSQWSGGCGPFAAFDPNHRFCFLAAGLAGQVFGVVYPPSGEAMSSYLRYACGQVYGDDVPRPL